MTKRASITDPAPISGVDAFTRPRYVWLFQCSRRLALHAASLDAKGRSLPKCLCAGGRWNRIGQLVLGPEPDRHVAVDVTALKAGIEQYGYYLWSADAEVLPSSLRLMR
jgi:hypothetical protein